MKYRGPRVKIARKLGPLPGLTNKLEKIKLKKQTITPGQRGKPHFFYFKKKTTYGLRLLEKQKLRYYYNITERQLVRYVKLAKKMKGATGTILLQLLNMRLDTIIFRLGLAPTIPAARQLINHGHIQVNKRKVDIPSYICKPKDIIKPRPKSLALVLFKSKQPTQRKKPTIKKKPTQRRPFTRQRFKRSTPNCKNLHGLIKQNRQLALKFVWPTETTWSKLQRSNSYKCCCIGFQSSKLDTCNATKQTCELGSPPIQSQRRIKTQRTLNDKQTINRPKKQCQKQPKHTVNNKITEILKAPTQNGKRTAKLKPKATSWIEPPQRKRVKITSKSIEQGDTVALITDPSGNFVLREPKRRLVKRKVNTLEQGDTVEPLTDDYTTGCGPTPPPKRKGRPKKSKPGQESDTVASVQQNDTVASVNQSSKGTSPVTLAPRPTPQGRGLPQRSKPGQKSDTVASVNLGSKGTSSVPIRPTPKGRGLPQKSKPVKIEVDNLSKPNEPLLQKVKPAKIEVDKLPKKTEPLPKNSDAITRSNPKKQVTKNSAKKQKTLPAPEKSKVQKPSNEIINTNLKSVLKPIFKGSFVELQKTFPLQPVWIRGKQYKTISEAKRKLREPVTVVIQKCANPKNVKYKFLKQTLNPRLTYTVQNKNTKFLETLYPYVYGNFPTYCTTKRELKSVNINGTYYTSMPRAARVLNSGTNYPSRYKARHAFYARKKDLMKKLYTGSNKNYQFTKTRKKIPNLRLIFLQTWRYNTKVQNQFLKLIWKMLRYKYGCSWKQWLNYGIYSQNKLPSIEKVPFIHSSRTFNFPLKRNWVQVAKYRGLIRTQTDIKFLAILSNKKQSIPSKLSQKLNILSRVIGKKIQGLLLPRTVSMYDVDLAKKKQSQKLINKRGKTNQPKSKIQKKAKSVFLIINQKIYDSEKAVINQGLANTNNQIKKRLNSVSKQWNQWKKITSFPSIIYEIDGQFFTSAQSVINSGLVQNRNQLNARLQSNSGKWLTWKKRRLMSAHKNNKDAVQRNHLLLPKMSNFASIRRHKVTSKLLGNGCKDKTTLDPQLQITKRSNNANNGKNIRSNDANKGKNITGFNKRYGRRYKPPKKYKPKLLIKGLRGFSKKAFRKRQAQKKTKLQVRRLINKGLKITKSRRPNPNIKTKGLLNQKPKTITITHYLRFNPDKKIAKVIRQPPRRLAKELHLDLKQLQIPPRDRLSDTLIKKFFLNVLLVVEYFSGK